MHDTLDKTIQSAWKFGFTPWVLSQIYDIADKHEVVISLRPPNRWAAIHLGHGCPPKPLFIKAKSVTKEDCLITGWPDNFQALVARYDPREYIPEDEVDQLPKELAKRYRLRLNEFLHDDNFMEELIAEDRILVTEGFIFSNEGFTKGKPFVSDIDVFAIGDLDNKQISIEKLHAVLSEFAHLNLGVRHGPLADWLPLNEHEKKRRDYLVALAMGCDFEE